MNTMSATTEPTRGRLRVRVVLGAVVLLTLGVSCVFYLLENTDLSALDGLFLQGKRRLHREAVEEVAPTTGGVDRTTTAATSTVTGGKSTTTKNGSTSTTISKNPFSTINPNSPLTTSTIPTNTTPTIPPTTTTPVPCSERPLPLAEVCTLTHHQEVSYLGPGVVLGELADTFFSTIALDALATRCVNGTWCLGYDLDKDLLLGDARVYMDYCDMDACLQHVLPECMTPTRRLTISTLRLLCDARMLNVSDRCILGIKKMTHVALVGEVLTVNETGPNCSIDTAGDCTVGCVELAQQVSAMWAACYGEMDAEPFTRYGQWEWVFEHAKMDNSTEICNQNNTQWPSFSDSTVLELKVFQQMLYRIQQNGPAVLAGVVTALVVTVAGFGIIFWACAKKVYVFYEYSRDRVEYTEVKESPEVKVVEDFDNDEEEDEMMP